MHDERSRVPTEDLLLLGLLFLDDYNISCLHGAYFLLPGTLFLEITSFKGPLNESLQDWFISDVLKNTTKFWCIN